MGIQRSLAAARGHFKPARLKQYPLSIIRLVLLVGLSFLIISPIIFKLSTALKSTEDIYNPSVFLLPKHPTTEYIRDVLDFVDYGKTFFSTVLFTLVNAALQIISCTLVAYGIGRFKYWGHPLVVGAVLTTLFVPTQTILLPLFLQFKSFSLPNLFAVIHFGPGVDINNTYWPFVFMSASALGLKNGLFIFMLSRFFKNMPNALEEAAYIDGCGMFRTFTKIMLPSARTLIVTVFVLSFVWIWNDNYYSAYFGSEMNILASLFDNVGFKIANLSGERNNTLLIQIYNSTAVFIHMIPLIVIYGFAQRLFVQGVEKSGIVG